MTFLLRAEEKMLSCWSGPGAQFGRYDYKHEEHRLSDMLNDDYFGSITYALRPGDHIMITDCEDQIMNVRVDHIERHQHKVYLSRLERIYAMPVVTLDSENPDDPGLVRRWRARNGGGHSIMTAKGELVAISFPSKEVAEQAIRIMYETKRFIPPVGHEPTKQFVRDTPIFRGQ